MNASNRMHTDTHTPKVVDKEGIEGPHPAVKLPPLRQDGHIHAVGAQHSPVGLLHDWQIQRRKHLRVHERVCMCVRVRTCVCVCVNAEGAQHSPVGLLHDRQIQRRRHLRVHERVCMCVRVRACVCVCVCTCARVYV